MQKLLWKQMGQELAEGFTTGLKPGAFAHLSWWGYYRFWFLEFQVELGSAILKLGREIASIRRYLG